MYSILKNFRLAYFVILSLIIATCNSKPKEEVEVPVSLISEPRTDSLNNSFFDSTTVEPNSIIRFNASHLINYNVLKLTNANEIIDTAALRKKKDSALDILNYIVNTKEFKADVLASDFSRSSRKRQSNLEIYQQFVSQEPDIKKIREHLTLEIDTTEYWNITMQNNRHPTVGFDNQPGDSTVNTVQVQLVKRLTPKEYAAHIAHEYCHMLGYSHPWPGKFQGVPYGIQYIIENF